MPTPHLMCFLLKEGLNVVIIKLLHLLQEAAVLFLWSVTYQTLKDNSGQT